MPRVPITICHIACSVDGRQVPGLGPGLQQRGRRIAPDIIDAVSGDAEQPDLIMVAKAVGQLGLGRRDVEREIVAAPPDHDRHRHAGIEADILLNILEALDLNRH